MKRRWNAFVWAGFGVTVAALMSYVPLFARYPATRDFPWVNLLLFATGGCFLGIGLKRAFGDPQSYGGKLSGIVLSALSILTFSAFCYYTFYFSRKLPSSIEAPRPGQPAPDFVLSNPEGKPVALSELLKRNRAVLLIFYRGYW